MAAPYKNNTLKGVLGNVEANRQYVNNAVGEFADATLDNAADAIVSADNQIRSNLKMAYNDAVNAADAVGNFFTGDAVLTQAGKVVPSVSTGNQLKSVTPYSTTLTPSTAITNMQDVNSPLNQSNGGNGQGLQNADLNFNQYGDDSSAANQATAGGMREKNTGEGVATSQMEYNPNADMNNLNYKYGKQAQYANSDEANYLAKRNDEIASALYNAGLVEKADVIQYLANQPGWNDSTEADRVNTVESIWKRMGELSQSNQGEKTTNGEYTDSIMQNMQSELDNSEGRLYGKTTADEGNSELGIPAMVDANNVYNSALESRMAEVRAAIAMGSEGMALALAYGDSNFSENILRDVQTYAPEFWAEVQTKVKNIRSGDVANAIASGESVTSNTNASIDNVNNGVNSWAESNATTPQQASYNIANISSAMADNQNATSAVQLIDNLNAQIEDYQMKISNLEKEANKIFKGDVPDYIVNAYINNRRLKYQEEITKLEGRKDSALDMYKFELNYELDKQGMNLKYLEYQRNLNNDSWEKWYKEQQLNMDNVKIIDGKAYRINNDGTMTQLTDATAYAAYQADVNTALQGYAGIYTAGGGVKTHNGYKYNVSGGQCQEFTNNFTEMTTGLRMNGKYASDKLSYRNTFVPTVGSIAIGVGGVYDSVYGHTMLVTGYDQTTGIVDLLWSNKDGDELVYSTQETLEKLYANGLQGFRDPYLDLVKQNSNYNIGYNENGVLITPMTPVFDKLIAKGDDTGGVAGAERTYTVLYEMLNDGSLDALINSGDFGKMWNFISKSQFTNTEGDEGVNFWNSVNEYKNKYMAKEFSGGDASIKALNKLMTLAEKKLRKESGAVINSGEWKGAFELFMPKAGESKEVQWDKMGGWDNLIIESLRAGGMESVNDYIPLFPKGGKREIW